MFEFLLINHPLDCPVCDKGGECPLQDFSYSFGPNESRMEFPRRVFDGEGVRADVDFGPTLMLNRNRCILCTRCVRFMREIDADAQINIVDRGYGSEIATFREEGVHSLLSGNLMDVCPVGAITTRDYRFKSRPWDNPEAVDTICTLCEKGCNTTAWIKAKPEWAKGARLARMTPRLNPEVNGYWMCDIGRFDYHWIEGDERLQRPLLRSRGWHAGADGLDQRARRSSPTAIGAGGGPRSLRFLLSAHASLEELFVVGRLGGAFGVPEEGVGDQLAPARQAAAGRRRSSRSRRSMRRILRGARDLGFPVTSHAGGRCRALGAFRVDVQSGKVAALYVFDPGPAGSIGDLSWVIAARKAGALKTLIVHGVLMTDLAKAADIVLPGAAWVEKDATYVNGQGRLQAAARVIAPPGRRAGRLAGVRQRRPGARRAGARTRAARRSAPSSRRRCPATLPTRELATLSSRGRCGAALAAGVEPVRAMEVGLHVPGPAAGEVRGHAARDVSPAAQDSAPEGGLTVDPFRVIRSITAA